MNLSNPPQREIQQYPNPEACKMFPSLSFEFFPPRDLQASFQLWETAQALAPFGPNQVSVTYGAGGTTREATHDTVVALQTQGHNVAAHLTCVGATKAQTLAVADRYKAAGVDTLVALRGDMPGGARFAPTKDGFASSLDLISALVGKGFDIHVGAYPDSHPDAADMTANINWLKRKVDAGASAAITQFFFDADVFLRFRDACHAAGVTIPLIPGILPVHSWNQTRVFAARCGTPIAPDIACSFDRADRDDRSALFALAHCTELCTTLMEEGVSDLHFYTLNRPTLTRDVLRALNCPAVDGLRNVA